jgi:hypothetical protein
MAASVYAVLIIIMQQARRYNLHVRHDRTNGGKREEVVAGNARPCRTRHGRTICAASPRQARVSIDFAVPAWCFVNRAGALGKTGVLSGGPERRSLPEWRDGLGRCSYNQANDQRQSSPVVSARQGETEAASRFVQNRRIYRCLLRTVPAAWVRSGPVVAIRTW